MKTTLIKISVFLIIVAPIFFIFYPFLFGGMVNMYDGDAVLQYYPLWSWFGQQEGIPLWQSNMLGGFPAYASVTGGFFYPLNQLFKLIDPIQAYSWLLFIDFVLLGLSSYWLGRTLKLFRIPSLVIALTLVFSQFFFYYGANMMIAHIYFVLPLLFVSLLKIYQRKYWYILLGGLAMGIGWLAGHVQFVSFIAVAGFLFALFLDIFKPKWAK